MNRPGITRQSALLTGALAIAGLVVMGATYVVVRGQVDAVYSSHYRELEAIGRLRVAQVTAWQDERLGDVRATAESPIFSDAVVAWVAGSDDPTLWAGIETELRLALDANKSENVLILGLDGRALTAARPDHVAIGPETLALVERVAASDGRPAFNDAVFEVDATHVHVDVAAAIRNRGGEPVAVLLLRSDPAATLYLDLLAWPTESPSGETLLVRRTSDRVVLITAPRLAEAPVGGIDLARDDVPAVQTARGRVGRFEGTDYRGIAVLADRRPVPGSQWYLVDKVDLAEVAAEAREVGGLILALAIMTVLLATTLGAAVFVVRRRLIVRRLDDAERERTAVVQHFDRLFALARDAFMLVDPSGRIVEANLAAEAAYGYSRDELQRLTIRDLRAPEARATVERDWAAGGRAEGVLFETVHLRSDGTSFPVEISSRVLDIDGQPYRQSIIRDITERKRAEAALDEQLAELRRWNALTLGREARVLDLKREVNELLGVLGRSPRYDEDPSNAGDADHG